MGDDWEALFGADLDEEDQDVKAGPETDIDEIDDAEDEKTVNEDNASGDEPAPKKGPFGRAKKDKPEKPAKEKKIHGLKRKETKDVDPYENAKGGHGKIALIAVGAVILIAAIGAGGLVANKRVQAVTETNENLTQQISNRTKNIYTAKRDIKAGDEIVTSGNEANVELSQVYTSLADSAYIAESTTGYAQVDIKAGMPVMANEVADTNPITELNNAVEEAVAPYLEAKTMPYKITAEFIDLSTGDAIAEERDLLLDNGANEKAFNTEADTIDGYKLSTIKVDGESVHAYGISEKSMKGGIVSMYYYTTKGGWGRHEMKGNIRVIYGYLKQTDPAADETDVFDDSAWIEEPEETTEETVAETTIDPESAETEAENAELLAAEETAETANEAATESTTEEAAAE